MQKATILIVTEQFDFHSDAIILKLRERGHEPVRLSIKDLPLRSSIDVAVNERKFSALIKTQKRIIDLNEIHAIWWRRPEPIVVNPRLSKDHGDFVRKEYQHVMGGIWRAIQCYWLSFPEKIYNASFKPEQLVRASGMGFSVPNTIITSDPQQAVDFVGSCKREVIYKPLSPSLMHQKCRNGATNRKATGVFTTLVDKRKVERVAEDIRNSPCMFQEYIEKRIELRVTVIGEEIFVAEIDSQSQERTRIDWRHYDVPMRIKKGKLPKQMEDLCRRFVRSYELEFSAMDLILTPKGEYVFLENNPNGQFMFVEEQITDYRMADTLIDLLIKGNNRGVME